MTLLTRLLLILLFWSTSGYLIAQQSLRFRYLDKRDGLTQNTIFAITQDGDGFMWFGTRNGLNRYDGYTFKHYFHKEDDVNSLINNDIRCLYYDQQDSCIWIGTRDGLSKFSLLEERFYNFGPDSLPAWGQAQRFIRHITRDPNGRLWLGMNVGLSYWDENAQAFSDLLTIEPSAITPDEARISVIEYDQEGRIWVGGASGVYFIAAAHSAQPSLYRAEETFPQLADLRGKDVRCLAEDHQGNIWIGTLQYGLYRWNPQTQILQHFEPQEGDPNSLGDNNVRS
ncbi:MAG: two-component regulator propeller domain-containing protein, partial [Bacteroidota bacterium]